MIEKRASPYTIMPGTSRCRVLTSPHSPLILVNISQITRISTGMVRKKIVLQPE